MIFPSFLRTSNTQKDNDLIVLPVADPTTPTIPGGKANTTAIAAPITVVDLAIDGVLHARIL